MLYLKACPRCRGDLFTEQDGRTKYLSCLQCGNTLNEVQEFVAATGKGLATAGAVVHRSAESIRRGR